MSCWCRRRCCDPTVNKYRWGRLGKLDSPPTLVLVVIAQVPLHRGSVGSNNQSYSVVLGTRDLDIEIPVIVNALDSPQVALPGNFPLR